jgi:hypothetical protein
MPTPASGPISLLDLQNEFGGSAPISFSEYYAGAGLVPGSLPISSGGVISLSEFYNKVKYIAGQSGVLTGAGYYFDYTLPSTSSPTVYVVLIGGGGGGGGGTGRTQNTGPYSGGGGGGAGDCRLLTLTGMPGGATLRCYIGPGGSAGAARDGGYSGGSSGGVGGDTLINYNNSLQSIAYGGNGGTVSQVVNYPYMRDVQSSFGGRGVPPPPVRTFFPSGSGVTFGGDGNTGRGGVQLFSPERGEGIGAYSSFRTADSFTALPSAAELTTWPQGGGYGGRGYDIYNNGRYVVQGSRSIGGLGNDREPWSQFYYYTQLGQFREFTAYGLVDGVQSRSYGAGGPGGGKNNEYAGPGGNALNGKSGTSGAIAIYWD